MNQQQKRRFDRVSFEAEAELHVVGKPPRVVLVHDISLHGALTESKYPLDLELGDEVKLLFYLSNEVMITMPAKLRMHNDTLYGFEAGTLDIDSIAHLRRLVELNLGSEELVHRNLEALFE